MLILREHYMLNPDDKLLAYMANAYIGFGKVGTRAKLYLQDAILQHIPYNYGIVADSNTVAFVAVNTAKNVTNKEIEDTKQCILNVLRGGGIVVMQTDSFANRAYNINSVKHIQQWVCSIHNVQKTVFKYCNRYSIKL